MADIGTRKLFENDKVILWELFLDPGELLERHTHQRDYLFYVIDGSTLEVAGANGQPDTIEIRSGDTLAFHLDDEQLISVGGKVPAAPVTHSARNVGDSRYREIIVEMKA